MIELSGGLDSLSFLAKKVAAVEEVMFLVLAEEISVLLKFVLAILMPINISSVSPESPTSLIHRLPINRPYANSDYIIFPTFGKVGKMSVSGWFTW